MGDEGPGNGALDAGFEVLRQPPASAEPSKGSFDHSSARQQLESSGGIGAFDDFEGPLTERGHGVAQLIAGITAVCEDVAQPRIERTDRRQQVWRAIAILYIGGVNPHVDQVTSVSVTIWRLRPLIFFPASKPLGPPHSVVFTDWLSMTPAVGLASRPAVSRRAMTSMWLMCASKPLCDQA
jgi:hypothetical protein